MCTLKKRTIRSFIPNLSIGDDKMEDKYRDELKALNVSDDAIGVLVAQELHTPESLATFTYADYVAMGIKAGSAKILVANYFKPPEPVASPPASADIQMPSMDILPAVPDDESFLAMIKVGGVLKVDKADVISAVRAGIAANVGLFGLPDILLKAMEDYADVQEEPVGTAFIALYRTITSRNNADLLAALEIPGSFVNERRKKALIERLNERLWPALYGFHTQLHAWNDAWSAGLPNQNMALYAIAASWGRSGGAGIVLPPGIMTPPDTAPLRDEIETVINKINGVFSGMNRFAARAMAYDAMKIRNVLEDPTLPAAAGFTTREQMLKGLGVGVGPDYPRLERSLTRLVLAIMEFPSVTPGGSEYAYLGALLQLESAIPWDKLSSTHSVKFPGKSRPAAQPVDSDSGSRPF
jgi:hypothetical protein